MAQAKKSATTKKVAPAKTVKAEKAVKAPVIKVAKKAIKVAATEELAAKAVESIEVVEEKASKVTKAGKHSVKALKEAEVKAIKAQRKAHKEEVDEAEKATAKPKVVKARTRLERQGKKLQDAAKLIEKGKEYSLKEACELVAKTSPVKFDATVELHIRLGVDPKLADQNIRANIVLPSGTGKTIRVAVMAEPDKLDAAKAAGADIATSDEFLQQLEKGQINFDVLIATPTQMPKLGKYAKLLGPKGLMPNPKSGTVTTNVAKAVKEAKGGKVEYRIDANGIVHLGIGKISFGPAKILDNVTTVLNSIKAGKPASVKSTYILSVFITSSMGPSIKIALADL
jgi:large subunit ribosomal protein L1